MSAQVDAIVGELESLTVTESESTPAEPSDALDTVLKEYLDLIDEYQSLQARLGSLFSSGFLSLSQANYASRSSVRYGQDYYDERMQSTVKLLIAVNGEDHDKPIIKINQQRWTSEGSKSEESVVDVKEEERSSQETARHGLKVQDNERSKDPLRWFGILVPPPLRAAQKDFSAAVEAIPRLIEVQFQLRRIEQQVQKLREQQIADAT